MRIDQLVQHRPGDDDRVRFGPGVTVFAGLDAHERADLIETIVDAVTGRIPSASIVYCDHAGRKIFADRTGATFADTGAPAPALQDLLGTDPSEVAARLTVTARDLGLGEQVSAADLEAELARARADLERLEAEHAEIADQAERVGAWRAELAELDRQLERADEDAARWAWVELRRRLDHVRTGLAQLDRQDHGATDRQLLDAVDAIRATGETWAELASTVSELRGELGNIPNLSLQDLDRVAATPPELPEGIDARLEAWRAAAGLRRGADDALARAARPVAEPEDPVVVSFAALPQTRLWAARSQLEHSTEAYDDLATSINRGEIDPDTEELIEQAHLEVIRRQRDLESRRRPGVLASTALGVGALLAGQQISLILGAVTMAAAFAMAVWLIAIPRRRVSAANVLEQEALDLVGAASWLGLHLRRLDAVTDRALRKQFESAANARAAARIDWDEVAGSLTVADLDARADAVRAYADAIDPRTVTRRLEEARALSVAAREAEHAARNSLTGGLDAYGLPAGGGVDLDPEQLLTVLSQRIRAGQVARRAKKLSVLAYREAEAARQLDDLLSQLGFEEGDLESRLGQTVDAVSAARHRRDAGTSTRAEVMAEIESLERQIATATSAAWVDGPDPTAPPTDPDLLAARRTEVTNRLVAAGRPDVDTARRLAEVCRTQVADLGARLEQLAAGPGSLRNRLTDRLARNTWLGDHEESAPVLLDEPFLSVPVAERLDLLDLVVRLTEKVQVLLLTADPVVARWARDRSARGRVTLYEAEPEPLLAGPGPVALADGAVPLSARVASPAFPADLAARPDRALAFPVS